MIQSIQNKLIKQILSLKSKKGRDRQELFLIEGEKFVGEIPAGWPVYCYVITEGFAGRTDAFHFHRDVEVITVSDKVFAAITDTVTPQGILAVCREMRYTLPDVLVGGSFFILAEEVSDPGNAGTLIRTAHGLGADAIIFTSGSVDVYSPKAARAAAGSIFHIPILENVELADTMLMIRENSVQMVGSHLDGSVLLYNADFTMPSCLLIGNEAHGLSEEAAKMCDLLVKIPMPGMAESLNASVAGGILMYEVIRQRRDTK